MRRNHYQGHSRSALCPNLPPSHARPRAVDWVEIRLAKARGQYLDIEREMHCDTVDEIIAWEKDHPEWGRELKRHYPHIHQSN